MLEHFKAQLDRNMSPESRISKKYMQIIHRIRSIHFHSRFSDIAEDWLNSLHVLAEVTLPYLSIRDMTVIWRDIESATSFSRLPESSLTWFNFYKAVSLRNFRRIKEMAIELLSGDKLTFTDKNDYLLTALLLSHMALGEKEAAISVWKAYENQYNPPIEVRILMANLFFPGFKP
jgi:hypothetical protein